MSRFLLLTRSRFAPENRLEIALDPRILKSTEMDFKLLKFLILRIDSD